MSTYRLTIDLPPSPAGVPHARHLVRDVLRAWRAPQFTEDAELLVTELVANVVDHVEAEVFSLEMELAGPWLRIVVVDGSALRPVVRELSMTAERGRGMQLIAGIADRWGVEDHQGGKRVWFELSAPGGGEPAGLPSRPGGDGRDDSDRSTKESSR
jgi:hypothetical protein